MRFSLKTMLVAVFVSAVVCAVFFAVPNWLAIGILGLAWLLAPPMLIAGIVYDRGYGRAFSIGCASAGGCLPIVYAYGLMFIVGSFDEWSNLVDTDYTVTVKITIAAFFLITGLSGLAAMAVRWMSIRLQTRAEVRQAAGPSEYSVLHGRVTTFQMDSEQLGIKPPTDPQMPSR